MDVLRDPHLELVERLSFLPVRSNSRRMSWLVTPCPWEDVGQAVRAVAVQEGGALLHGQFNVQEMKGQRGADVSPIVP